MPTNRGRSRHVSESSTGRHSGNFPGAEIADPDVLELSVVRSGCHSSPLVPGTATNLFFRLPVVKSKGNASIEITILRLTLGATSFPAIRLSVYKKRACGGRL